MAIKHGCDTCNKSALSLILLRPSPVANMRELTPPGAELVESDEAVMKGLLPARLPTESRFVLRMLRAGYVHVYIESPPAGIKNWLVYRVTKQGDLVGEKSEWFAHPAANATCPQPRHNAMGMKLLTIPQAHKINEIWIAYSANLWNDALRNRNKANPKIMQKISLGGESPNAFKPTVANLQSKVMECRLTQLSIRQSTDHDFEFNSVASQVDRLAENLARAAACHPRTKGKELAIVLRDPVGITVELNALRLYRNAIAKQEIKAELEKPEIVHAFNSSSTLLGLKSLYEDVEFAKALDKWAPLATWREYTSPQPYTPMNPVGRTVAPLRWKGGTWEALPDERRSDSRINDSTLGRVWYPESIDRTLKESKLSAKKAWGDIEDEFDEAARKQWHVDLDARIKREHLDKLAKFEDDWWGARQDSQFNDYFAQHFDENDPNKPGALLCPGVIYACEVHGATTPAPFTTGQVLVSYLEELTTDPMQPSAVMLRSLVANQDKVIEKMKGVMWADAAINYAHDNRNDKLYDLSVAMVVGAGSAKNPSAAQKAIAKYSWLSAALGNVLGGYAISAVNSLSAAHAAAVAAKVAVGSIALSASRLAGASLVQRATDLALQSIIHNTSLTTPIIITKRFPAGRGLFLLTRGGHFTRKEAQGLIRNGHIEITLHSDSQEMAKAVGDMEQALLDEPNSNKVKVRGKQAAALLSSPAALAGITLTEAKFAELYAKGGTKWGDLVNQVKAGYEKMDANTGAGTIMRSLEGRLALGVILLNSAGALKAFNDLGKSDASDLARLEARLALTDGVCSVFAAITQLREIVIKSGLEKKMGAAVAESALEKLASVHGLRAAGFALGAVAGAANGWMNWARAQQANENGHDAAFRMYAAASFAFWGTFGLFLAQGAGAMAERAISKGISTAVLRAAAIRVAARFGAGSILGLTGWGTALLGIAVLFEAGAIAMTPSEMETWASRSKFGKASKKKFTSWEQEEAALMVLFGPIAPPSKEQDKPHPRLVA